MPEKSSAREACALSKNFCLRERAGSGKLEKGVKRVAEAPLEGRKFRAVLLSMVSSGFARIREDYTVSRGPRYPGRRRRPLQPQNWQPNH